MGEGNNTINAAMENLVLQSAQGHSYNLEALRQLVITGAMGAREGLTHRVIQESGGGQARAFLPAGMGGVPSIPMPTQ